MRSSLAFCLLIGLVYALPSGQKSQNLYQRPYQNDNQSRNENVKQNEGSLGWKSKFIYEYDVEGRALSGINEVSENFSGIVLRAKLALQRRRIGHTLYAELRNPKISEIHTVLPDNWESDISESILNFKPLPMRNRRFEIHFDREDVSYMVVDEQTSKWEINILRGVVTQLQMKLKSNVSNNYLDHFKLTTSHNVMEDSITGKCQTYYEISKTPYHIINMQSKNQNRFINIMKRRDYENCENDPGYNFGLPRMPNWEQNVEKWKFYQKSSISNAVINGTLSAYTIVSSQTTTTFAVSPHLYNNKNGITGSIMNLTLASTRQEHKEPPKVEGKKIFGLSYDYSWNKNERLFSKSSSSHSNEESEGSNESHDSNQSNESGHAQQNNQQRYWNSPEVLRYLPNDNQDNSFTKKSFDVKTVREITRKIASTVNDPDDIQTKHSLEMFTILASVMRTMTRQQLLEGGRVFYSDSEESGKSTAEWKVYRDAVTLAGTFESLDVIREWIENERVKGVEAADIIAALPRTARNVTDSYVYIYNNLVFNKKVMRQSYLNTTAIVSMGHLGRRVLYENQDSYENSNSRESDESNHQHSNAQRMIIDKIIPRYVKEMYDALNNHDHHKAQVYIRSLGNFAYSKIVDEFTKLLMDPVKLTDLERVLMVSSMDYLNKHSPQNTNDVLFYVYLDSLRFSAKVRATAVVQIMRSYPSAKSLQRLAAFTRFDTSEQVKNIVKTAIHSAAKLQDSQHREFAESAQSAIPYLSSGSAQPWYSRNEFYSEGRSDANIDFFYNIGKVNDENRRIPDAIYYLMKVNKGGFNSEDVKTNAMVSNVLDLWRALQDFESPSQLSRSRKSSYVDKIAEMLNIQSDEREPLQGNILFQFMGSDRLVTFDENTFKNLRQDLWKTFARTSYKNPLEYTKLFDAEEVTIGAPTELGIPFEYSHKNPTLMKVKVQGSVRKYNENKSDSGHSDESGGKSDDDNSYHGSSGENNRNKFNAKFHLELLYSTRVQAKVGFYTHHNKRHYLAGYDKNLQFHLPLNFSFNVDLEHKQMQIKISPQNPEDNTTVVHYSTYPYTAMENILDLTPTPESPDHSVMVVGVLSSVDCVYNSSNGFIFHLSGEVDEGYEYNHWPWSKTHNCLLCPNNPLLVFDDKIHYSKLQFVYVGELSASHDVSFNISMMKMSTSSVHDSSSEERISSEERHSSESNEDSDAGFESQTNQQQRQRQMLRKTIESIPSATANSVDISVAFSGQNTPRHTVSAAYASSKAKNEARAILFYNKIQDHSKPFQLYFTASAKAPHVSFLNYGHALNSNEPTYANLQLNYGESYKSGSQISVKAKLYKSNERQKALRNSPEAQNCLERNQQNKQPMYRCENATIRASLMDLINVGVEYSNVSPRVRNMTSKAYNYVKHLGYKYLTVNYVNSSGSGSQNKININANFDPQNFQTVNISINSPSTDAQYTNVPVTPWVQPLVVFHPSLSPVQRLKSKALGYYADRASCLLNHNIVWTFNNQHYPVHLGRCFHAVLAMIPREDNELPYVSSIEARDAEYFFDKEVKVLINATDRTHEILLYPRDSNRHSQEQTRNVNLKVNGRETNISPYQLFVIRASDNSAIGTILRLSNEEFKLNFPGVEVYYSVNKMRISVDENMRGRIRGLCGTFEQWKLDFTTPQNVVLLDPAAFSASYAIMGAECKGTAASQSQNVESISRSQIQCKPMNDEWTQVLIQAQSQAQAQARSNARSYVQSQSQGRNKQSSQYRQQQANCIKQQTQYVVEDNGKSLCFTVQPLTICQEYCKTTSRLEKSVGVHCLPRTRLSEMWKSQIDQGASPDFSSYKPTKYIKIKIAKECSMN